MQMFVNYYNELYITKIAMKKLFCSCIGMVKDMKAFTDLSCVYFLCVYTVKSVNSNRPWSPDLTGCA